jgi:DNA mismatch endonuclease (patch repair protein)
MDVLTPEQRAYCMSRIRSQNTGPEISFRKGLWALGVRYRIKNRLPGRPDLVISRARVVVFVDGCFWHRCPTHFVMPRTRRAFWNRKIRANRARDHRVTLKLKRDGWRVVRIWEHDIDKRALRACERVVRLINSQSLAIAK